MATQSAPRILITRLSHIGDCVLTLPIANAIRESYPNAWIGWATEPVNRKLLDGFAAVDQWITIPRGWLGSPKKILSVRRQLRQYAFDVAIDPQGLTKSAMLGWLSGAKTRIGFSRGWSGELAPWTYNRQVTPAATHIVTRSLELLKPLDIESPETRFDVPVDASALVEINDRLARSNVGAGFMLINPGASWPSKCWVASRFGSVAERIGQRFGVRSLVVWAGEAERSLAEEVVANSAGYAGLSAPTSLKELAALCSRARLCLSADTGPLHLAAALNVPCVGLYGATQPSHCGAYGSHCTNLQAWYQAGSRKQRRKADNVAMRDIQVEQVVEACEQRLRQQTSSSDQHAA